MSSIVENLHIYIIITGVILFVSVYASKITQKIGVPLLLIFLGLGMLLGEEGLVGIRFSNSLLAQAVGTVALIFILYNGGLETRFADIKSVIVSGVLLATFGVAVTAVIMACFIYFVLNFSFLEALLLGSIISSTDAAAVFMILRTQKIVLKRGVGELLELESGSNDPMAIFLTITILQLITLQSSGESIEISKLGINFILQFGVGIALGIAFGWLFPKLCDRLGLMQNGLYSLISVAWLFIMFGLSNMLWGNGFLTIYIAGILSNRYIFAHKESILAFHEALAWMMQIVVFLTLGLLVLPSNLPSVAFEACVLSLVLMFIARPLAVFLGLSFSHFGRNEKLYISWVGLRGAVPIILATYPYVYALPESDMIFNIVFFAVLVSVLIQGMSISFMAKKLNVVE